jgi:pimeloyl-ACP methyl ester carboxylesterase
MAARYWRMMLAWQLALASVIGLALAAPTGDIWLAPVFAVGAFIALQYAIIALTLVLSDALAGPDTGRGLPQAIGVALCEPFYFVLAQLALIRRLPISSATPEAGRDVITRSPLLLVHGLASNRGVWRWLLPRLRAAGFESIHAVNLEPMRAEIDVLAGNLAREVQRIRDVHIGSRITIVAHSMGGLIVRAALRSLPPEAIRHIVTIGTPHHGAALARTLRWPAAKQMRPGSKWLASLNALQEDHLPVPLTSIWSHEDNLVRPASSANLQGARCRHLRGLGHFGLLIRGRALDCVLRALREVP